jgi:TM2 domain-containing membrane protein YozV
MGLQSAKSKSAALTLAIFLGYWGAHKFYLGLHRQGVVYLFLSFTGLTVFFVIFDVFTLAFTPSNAFGKGRTQPNTKPKIETLKGASASNWSSSGKGKKLTYLTRSIPKPSTDLIQQNARNEQNNTSSLGMQNSIPRIGGSQPSSTDLSNPKIEKLWQKFLEDRLSLEPFRLKFEQLYAESDAEQFPHHIFNADVKLRYKGKNHVISHAASPLSDGLFHKSTCPKLDRYSGGWESKFYGDIDGVCSWASERLLTKSEYLVEVISEHQGLWRDYLLWHGRQREGSSASYLSDEERNFLPWTLQQFELLVPGFASELFDLVKQKKLAGYREISIRGLDGQLQIETQAITEQNFVHNLTEAIERWINDLRPECVHYETVKCILCGIESQPNLIRNLDLLFPNEICAWCFKLIDYHELSTRNAGKTQEEIREEAIDAFRLAVESFDFKYWKTPVLTRETLISLNLRQQSKDQVRVAAAILSAMPRDLIGFDSARHFFSETGLEEVLPPDRSRGKKSISRCGHLCLSLGEREICEYLFQRGIEHSREPDYHSLVSAVSISEFGFMRGDFLVGKVVIEYSGLSGDAHYDAKMQKKMELCRKYGISLIVVQPSDLKRLDTVFSVLERP